MNVKAKKKAIRTPSVLKKKPSKLAELKYNKGTNKSEGPTRVKTVPMKLRVLPISFWQQPNNIQMDSQGQEDEDEDLEGKSVKENKLEMTTTPDTDLLFSLFRKIDQNGDDLKTAATIRDDDPYIGTNVADLVSKTTNKTERKTLKVLDRKQRNCRKPDVDLLTKSNQYTDMLTDLVIKL